MRSSDSAVVLVGHGSRRAGFERAFRKVARVLQKGLSGTRVVCAYLEINAPSIPQAIDACVKAGARRVKVLPYFLLAGRHAREHLPEIVRAANARHHSRARVMLCSEIGFDKRIVDVLLERLAK